MKTAIIHLTSRCNLNCKHCYNISGMPKKNEFETCDWNKSFEILKNNGINSVILLGGEPMIIPNFLDILYFADYYFESIQVQTNGIASPINLIDFINGHNIGKKISFYVSIDNISEFEGEYYDDIRNIKLDNSFCFIKKLKQNNINIGIRSTITNENDYEKIIQFSKEMEVPLVFVRFLSVGRGKEFGMVTKERLKEVYEKVSNEKNATLFDCQYYIYNKDLFNKLNTKFLDIGICPFLSKSRIVLDSEGNVYGCEMFILEKDMILGNILTDDFNKIIENRNNLIKKLKNLETEKNCQKCEYLRYCNGGCMWIALKNNKVGDTNCIINNIMEVKNAR